jgi:hypothetical protein
MINVQPVPLEFTNQTWPLVEHHIAAALEEGDSSEPLYNLEHIKGYIASGSWLLLVAVDENNDIHGAATVSFSNHPLHRVAFITAIGGKLISNRDTVEQLKVILKQNGATILQAFGRPSIVRLWRRYNFESRNTLVEVLL